MDVRCEKCQTEYELDESRLKPGGVTVKCTNCGHMFKIRKRSNTNVGLASVEERPRSGPSRSPVAASDRSRRADSVLATPDLGTEAVDGRQWLIRLENGEQKSCRELATLQQWIVAGVVTRESLISRSGKTWKRLGDIAELGQYFVVADEAKSQRAVKPTPKPVGATMMGVGAKPARHGDTGPDGDDGRATGAYRPLTPTPPPPAPAPARTTNPPRANPMAQTEIAAPVVKRPPTQPPPVPQGNRATGGWAQNDVKHSESMAAMPQGPQGGNLSAIPDEPAFAGRVRVSPTDERTFSTDKVTSLPDDDDYLVPGERGSRAGLWLAIIAVLVIGAAAGVVYMVVFKKKATDQAAKPPADAAVVAVVTPDATAIVTPIPDAKVEAPSPLDAARAELAANVESRMRTALDTLAGKDEPTAQALRARIVVAIAQAEQDRAGLIDKAAGDQLRKDGKQLLIDASPLAQKAAKAQPDDPTSNLAMADLLRAQGKPARDVQRYIEQARAKSGGDKTVDHEVALAQGLLAIRDGKLDQAQQQLAAADTDAGDVRAKLALAMVAFAQNKAADAKSLVDQVLATQPDHAGAKALSAKLETAVAKSDPLPPEDGASKAGSAHAPVVRTPDPGTGGASDYDSMLARANKVAETNCTKAMDLFQKALEEKPNGVEALTGMGYCHLDAKQFSSAFSKFRAALAVSSRYEPALAGVAETYQQQNNKEQAIDAWRKYLDVYPSAAKAKKQLELLGASNDSGGGTTPPPAPPPAPAPAPTPVPSPAPAGGGSGSG